MQPAVDDLTRALTDEANRTLDQCLEQIRHCTDQLSDDQIWWRPEESMNSIGNLLLHLTGNIRQWIVSGIGGARDVRQRPREFSERGPIPRARLLATIEGVVQEAQRALSAATAAELLTTRRIQGGEITGLRAIFDSVSHFKGHTQEIVCLTRMQLGDGYRYHWRPQTVEQGAEAEAETT
jgi:hypothetical protein